MSYVHFYFSGWFQCRLATNPDPADEPRGVSGVTFAMADEPDLDRIIRFQNPVRPRSHGPAIGVKVYAVKRRQRFDRKHNLIGAAVDLLGNPEFYGRSGIFAKEGMEPIEPLIFEIKKPPFRLCRTDVWDPRDKSINIRNAPSGHLVRRQPVGFSLLSKTALRSIGISDFSRYRNKRRLNLEKDLQIACRRPVKLALERRIEELKIDQPRDRRVASLGWKLDYNIGHNERWQGLNGDAIIRDPGHAFREEVDLENPWPLTFWMGAWDCDALCGFVKGALAIPIKSRAALR